MVRRPFQFFADLEDRTCLITGQKRIDSGSLRAEATSIADSISNHEWQRIALINARVPRQLSTLQACQDTGTDLLLIRSANEWRPEFADDLNLDAVLDAQGKTISSFPLTKTQGNREVLLTTSGTTGDPKITRHSIEELISRIAIDPLKRSGASWMLAYHPASFAGLQVILTALLNRAVIIVPDRMDLQGLVSSYITHRPTHISGTPTFWRGLLQTSLSPESTEHLQQITLGGELTDQTLLDRLRTHFTNARIVHIYATTELGVIFSVNDERAGFPIDWLDSGVNGFGLRQRNGQLEVKRSPSSNNWIQTGDLIEAVGDRIHFRGRSDGVINVGGAKANPEEIEEALLSHPEIAEVHVYGRPNTVIGMLVSADVVLRPDSTTDQDKLRVNIHQFAAEHLAAHKIPRMIQFVSEIQISPTGKKLRPS